MLYMFRFGELPPEVPEIVIRIPVFYRSFSEIKYGVICKRSSWENIKHLPVGSPVWYVDHRWVPADHRWVPAL